MVKYLASSPYCNVVDKLEVCKYHLDLLVLEPIPPYKTYSANPLIVYVSNGLWPVSLSFQLLNLINCCTICGQQFKHIFIVNMHIVRTARIVIVYMNEQTTSHITRSKFHPACMHAVRLLQSRDIAQGLLSCCMPYWGPWWKNSDSV